MPTELPLDALEMALWTRARAGHCDDQGRLDGLVHHSDAGAKYTAIRYADRLADAGALASIGTVGDSYDNAIAESVIGRVTRAGGTVQVRTGPGEGTEVRLALPRG